MTGSEHREVLPEVNDQTREELRAQLGEQILFYQGIRGSFEPVSFEAQLPVVVGYVPLAERPFFSRFDPTGRKDFPITFGHGEQVFTDLSLGMPETMHTISEDMAALETFGLISGDVTINRDTTGAEVMERALMLWHADPPAPFYLISDRYATQHYRGRATFVPEAGMTLGDLPEVEVDNPAFKGVQGPDFAIVRMAPPNVHKKPIFPNTAERTIMIHYTRFKTPV